MNTAMILIFMIATIAGFWISRKYTTIALIIYTIIMFVADVCNVAWAWFPFISG